VRADDLVASSPRPTNRLSTRAATRAASPAAAASRSCCPTAASTCSPQHALGLLGATAVQIGYRLKAGEIAHILSNAEPAVTLVHADYLAEDDPGPRAGRPGGFR